MRRAPLLLVLVALSGCGGSSTKPKTTSAEPAPPRLSVVIRGENHHPLVGRKWHYEVRVTADGKPVSCRIHLQFLFSGAPVGQVGRHTLDWRQLLFASLVQARDGAQQAQRVGMLGVAEQLLRRGRLDNVAGVHDVDPVA